MTLQAVLWDMDGTLVDSEKVWAEVQIELLASLGAVWTVEDCMTLVGSDLRDAVQVWMARIPDGRGGTMLRPGVLDIPPGTRKRLFRVEDLRFAVDGEAIERRALYAAEKAMLTHAVRREADDA